MNAFFTEVWLNENLERYINITFSNSPGPIDQQRSFSGAVLFPFEHLFEYFSFHGTHLFEINLINHHHFFEIDI